MKVELQIRLKRRFCYPVCIVYMQPLRNIMEEQHYEVRDYRSRFRMSTKLKSVLTVLGGILLIVGVIVFSVSWETLEPLEYGLVSHIEGIKNLAYVA